MRQIADLLTDKKVVTGSSVLALALGMGVLPAQAELITTAFTQTQTQDLNNGQNVYFGPTSDPSGFYANMSLGTGYFGEPAEYFNLTGVGANGVADETELQGPDGSVPAPMPCNSPSNGCKLQTYSPGQQVDGTANFQTTGEFKTADYYEGSSPNGNYYFGLDDIGSTPDPFGWAEITLNDGAVTLDQFAFEDNNIDPAPIPAPEPTPLSLFVVGAAAVLALRRKKARAQAI